MIPRIATLAIASVVVGAALVAAPFVAATAQASTSSAEKLEALIDHNRVDVALTKFLHNDAMDAYAQGFSDSSEKCPSCGVTITDLGLPGSASHSKYIFTVTGSTASSRISKAMLYIEAHYEPQWETTTSNYSAVGWTTKGTKTWVTFAIADYTSTPFDKLGHAKVSGTPAVGQLLKGSTTGYSPSATGTTYDWMDGATELSDLSYFEPSAAQLGHTLTMIAHVTRPGYISMNYQVKVGPVKIGTFVHPSKLTMYGSKHVGQQLYFEKPGQWSSAANFTIQWLRNGTAIAGANGLSYTLTSADLGKKVDVKVVASALGYKTVTMQTHTSTKIGDPYLTVVTAPKITGDSIVGDTLTGVPPTWGATPSRTANQWFIGGKAVKGATHTTFVVPASAAGKQVEFEQVATLKGYAQSWDYATTPIIAKGTIHILEYPSMTGDEIVGSKVSVTKGEYDPSSVTVSYQWFTGTHEIKGATHSYRTIKASDLTGELLLRITVKKTGYTTITQFFSE